MANTKNNSITPKVYSYIRFSTPEQSLGDSERRQLEKAQSYAIEKELNLDETLIDRGYSGYHADHKKKGALGRFLFRVKKGEVGKGSVLLVENVDRLSREPLLDAFQTISDLLKSGVNIQTLFPYEFYDVATLNEGYKIFELIGQIKRAHEESELKSERVGSIRKKSREAARSGKKINMRVPAWLKSIKDGDGNTVDYKEVPGAKKTIRFIFKSKLKGLSLRHIERQLNANAQWQRPNGWRVSYIKKILTNRAVIGEYQPCKRNSQGEREPVGKPILDYYPKMIDENTFLAVQRLMKENKANSVGGRADKAWNIFKHLVKCPYCGGSMTYVDKGKGTKGGCYLVCDNGRRGLKCNYDSIKYEEVKSLVLGCCTKLNISEILPDQNEVSETCSSLRNRIQGHLEQIAEFQESREQLRQNIKILKNPTLVDECEKEWLELGEKIKEIEEQKRADEGELNRTETMLKSVSNWQKDLSTFKDKIKGDSQKAIGLRMHTNTLLRQLIERIDIYASGAKEVYDPDKDPGEYRVFGNGKKLRVPSQYEWSSVTIGDYINDMAPDIPCQFIEDLENRCMTKEGRFIIAHFKGGRKIKIVPEKSLASGMRYDKMGPVHVSPPIGELYEKWKS